MSEIYFMNIEVNVVFHLLQFFYFIVDGCMSYRKRYLKITGVILDMKGGEKVGEFLTTDVN